LTVMVLSINFPFPWLKISQQTINWIYDPSSRIKAAAHIKAFKQHTAQRHCIGRIRSAENLATGLKTAFVLSVFHSLPRMRRFFNVFS
jgi:hypothetical protein